jgi:hypothetical protein
VAPRRGVLYDRNLHELAMTVQADSILRRPSEIDDKQAAARALAASCTPILNDAHSPPSSRLPTASPTGTALPGSRAASTPEWPRRVKALNLKGIYFQKEFQRFYPDNEIAAQVLGYVGVDDNGLGGLERNSSRNCTASGPHVHRHGRAPQGAWLQRARARAGPATWFSPSTRTFSSGRARARSRHAKTQAPTAPWWCRTCTPARFWRSPSGPHSIPTFRHTTPGAACATTP